MTVFEQLQQLLTQQQASFDVLEHPPVYTSQEAATVRGTPLASGAKALICKCDGEFVMFVMPANMKLASKSVRKREGYRSLRFASADEVLKLTGLRPGSIPPFGSLFRLKTRCDKQLAKQKNINFNAGDHSISISLAYSDFERVENPQLGMFAEETQ